MFQRSLNLSNRTFKIDAKISDLLRGFKAGLVKVGASIRGPIRAVVGPFNEPSKLLNLKFCQQPFTNVLFCSKVGIIRNEI